MKIKVTERQVKECFSSVYRVGYCNIQYIESYLPQVMYTSGVYGWNSDIYNCENGCAISTGYRPCGNKHIDYDITEKYNNRFARLKHKTSVKAIQYLQAMIKEQKERDNAKTNK